MADDPYYIDPMIKTNLNLIRDRVLNKDLDYVCVIDGEEGVGKSVLAMQLAKYLCPDFCLDNIVFTSDDFIRVIKDPKVKKGTVIILDEAFNAANSRASLTEVNRSMIGLASEMRQKNLIVFLIIPTFFDLDRNFSIWRSKALFHVYFTNSGERRFVVYAKNAKKDLWIAGKKRYSYSFPRATLPPARFYNTYTVDEKAYREKKAMAFNKRTVSNRAKGWLEQRNFFIKYLVKHFALTQVELEKLLAANNIQALGSASFSMICNELIDEGEEELAKTLSKKPINALKL